MAKPKLENATKYFRTSSVSWFATEADWKSRVECLAENSKIAEAPEKFPCLAVLAGVHVDEEAEDGMGHRFPATRTLYYAYLYEPK